MKRQLPVERLAGALLVLALHGAALWVLASQRLIRLPELTPTLFVDLIAPAAPPPPLRAETPRSHQPLPPSIAPTPVPEPVTASAAISPATSQAPATPGVEIGPPPAPTPARPVTLGGELAIACSERPGPEYPLPSRRRNESGTTLLQVELDESGQIAAATVLESSGWPRLDAAALAAVRSWRCAPAQSNGRAVRAHARQAFKFVLQGS